MEGYHKSVLLKEVLEFLEVQKDGWYLDCTLGDGGYTLEILQQGGRVLGLDVDPQALERTKLRLADRGMDQLRYKLVRGNFNNLIEISQAETGNQKFKGIVFDLGVSSLQLEDPARGFSFGKNGPLDMRMDPRLEVTAADLLKVLRKDQLYELFSKLGEERLAKRFAQALVSAGSVATTTKLAQIIEKAAGSRRGKIHPATRVFQALRIAVNDELTVLEEALPQALELLETNGHIIVISFHSLEDRIVKRAFSSWHDQGLGQVLTKKPLVPPNDEISSNPRSRSAKLRVFQKNDNYKKVRIR